MTSLLDSVLVSCMLPVGSAPHVKLGSMVWKAVRCLVAQVTVGYTFLVAISSVSSVSDSVIVFEVLQS